MLNNRYAANRESVNHVINWPMPWTLGALAEFASVLRQTNSCHQGDPQLARNCLIQGNRTVNRKVLSVSPTFSAATGPVPWSTHICLPDFVGFDQIWIRCVKVWVSKRANPYQFIKMQPRTLSGKQFSFTSWNLDSNSCQPIYAKVWEYLGSTWTPWKLRVLVFAVLFQKSPEGLFGNMCWVREE